MSTSLPRPAILALLGVVLIGGLFMLSRKGGSDESSSPPPPAPAAPAATPTPGGTAVPPAAAQAPTTPNSAPKPNAAAKEPRSSQSRTLPGPVARALKSHKVVVLLFWSPRGVDDRAVKSAVNGLSHDGGKVAIFSDKLRNLARYTKITAGANIVQTPTLVVTNKKGEARVATGYLDPDSVE